MIAESECVGPSPVLVRVEDVVAVSVNVSTTEGVGDAGGVGVCDHEEEEESTGEDEIPEPVGTHDEVGVGATDLVGVITTDLVAVESERERDVDMLVEFEVETVDVVLFDTAFDVDIVRNSEGVHEVVSVSESSCVSVIVDESRWVCDGTCLRWLLGLLVAVTSTEVLTVTVVIIDEERVLLFVTDKEDWTVAVLDRVRLMEPENVCDSSAEGDALVVLAESEASGLTLSV